MNERIRELKRAAWNYAHDHDTVKGELVFGDCINMNFSDAFTEKFAELILQECVSIIDKMAELPDDLGGNAYLKAGAKQIKRHFGVN